MVFSVSGSRDCPVQPIYVQDFPAEPVQPGSQTEKLRCRCTTARHILLRRAAHPASLLNARPQEVTTHPSIRGPRPTGFVGLLMGDVTLAREELEGPPVDLMTSGAASDNVFRERTITMPFGTFLPGLNVAHSTDRSTPDEHLASVGTVYSEYTLTLPPFNVTVSLDIRTERSPCL